MARLLRVQFKGAIYHVSARGNERRLIFRDDKDRKRFLQNLAQAQQRVASDHLIPCGRHRWILEIFLIPPKKFQSELSTTYAWKTWVMVAGRGPVDFRPRSGDLTLGLVSPR
jgi:hypothetical protein